MLSKDSAANGSSGGVTLAGATVNGNDFAFVVADGIEDFLQSIRGVGIVDDDREGLPFINDIHATFDVFKGVDA